MVCRNKKRNERNTVRKNSLTRQKKWRYAIKTHERIQPRKAKKFYGKENGAKTKKYILAPRVLGLDHTSCFLVRSGIINRKSAEG